MQSIVLRVLVFFFFFQAEDGIRDKLVTGVQTCALPISPPASVTGRVPLHRALHVARLALLVLGAVAAAFLLQWWEHPWLGSLADLAIAAAFLFIIGDAAPRALAAVAPQLSIEALPLARRTLWPFGPLLWLLGGADKGLHTLVTTPQPLEPDLRAAQRDMLLGVFTLADTTADEVMTPRLDMIAVDVAASAEDVRETFLQSEHSRLPVYDGTPDNLVGIVFAKDLVPLVMGVAGATVRWQGLVRPPLYAPGTKTPHSPLRDFQPRPPHLAILVDEFGGASGLDTPQEILEGVAGEIRDQHT